MTVKNLIEKLKQYEPDKQVVLVDQNQRITNLNQDCIGFTYTINSVYIYTGNK